MLVQKFINKIERKICPKKASFDKVCKNNGLNLNYKLNKSEIRILQEIFEERSYSEYFPFYESANIVDIGGHYGYFSIFASKNLSSNSKIYSFEASSDNYKCLSANLLANKITNVIAKHLGISDFNGQAELSLTENSNNTLTSNSGFSKVIVNINCLESVFQQYKIENVDFLKIDCEGSEYNILDSLSTEMFKKIRIISLEFHDLKSEKYNANYIVTLLENAGFDIKKFEYNKTFNNLNFGRIIAKNQRVFINTV